MDNLKKRRCSETQLEYLINYMFKNKHFANGKFLGVQGKKLQKDMWRKLTHELNNLGPTKTEDQWRKVWKNQKLLARKKNSEIKVSQRTTGNIHPSAELNEKEKKILFVIGKESSEGLGFGEGSCGDLNELSCANLNEASYGNLNKVSCSNLHEVSRGISPLQEIDMNMLPQTSIELSSELSEEENIVIICDHERPCVDEKYEHSKKENSIEYKSDTDLKKTEDGRKPKKASQDKYIENEFFEKLIESNKGISNALESVAQSNDKIASSIEKLTEAIVVKIK